MIIGLKGKIEKVEPNFVALDVHGVVYGIHISLSCSLSLKAQDEVKLLITEIIREDAFMLFGFTQKLEQEIFERLIKINGVGPKVAMAILSTFSPEDFVKIIESKNVQALQKVSGIGAKGASKIMVDLAGFFDFSKEDSISQAHKEASMALEGLGFKKGDIAQVLKKISAQETSAIIKEALKFFQQK